MRCGSGRDCDGGDGLTKLGQLQLRQRGKPSRLRWRFRHFHPSRPRDALDGGRPSIAFQDEQGDSYQTGTADALTTMNSHVAARAEFCLQARQQALHSVEVGRHTAIRNGEVHKG